MFTASVGLKIMSKRVDDVLCYLLGAIFVIDTKPVYNGQPRGITKVAFVDKWPLFRTSEITYPIFTRQIKTGLCRQETTIRSLFWVFLAFDFCRFCMVIWFLLSLTQRPMTSDFEGFSIPDFIHYIFFPILTLQKEPVFPF